MANFFTDNQDILFNLRNVDLAEAVSMKETGYSQAEEFDYAPVSYEDALDSYERVLKEIGEVAGERIDPRSRQVD